jgi:CHASE2 domain-containing sensor protein
MVMKVLGIAILVVAVLAVVIPVTNNCTAEGLFITTKDGRQIDMKCYWTSRASVAVAVVLGVVGILLAVSHRKETRRALGVIGVLLGIALVALPTELIGVCAMDKTCLNVMKPSLILLGAIAAALSIAAIALAGSGDTGEETPA